jgi:alpha-L-rhamnosidase
VYATAHGVYELELNGKRVGDHVLAPGWQSYSHHLNYQTYDVTSLIIPDEVNVLGAYVAEGWYAGRLVRNREIYGSRLALLAQLEIDDNVAVLTDDGWEWLHGPVLSSELYDGEAFDSRHQDRSWSTKDGLTATSSTQAVEVLPFPNTQLISPDAPPVRRIEYVTAKDVITTPSGKVVLDFGQNLVGWLKINRNIEGADGSEISLRHAEVMEHGELGTRPLRTAKARDIITLGGDVEGWEPRFTFHGFR